MRIGIEAQRLFRKKKHGMEVVALEVIRHLQEIDRENEYFIFVKEDEDSDCLTPTENFEIVTIPSASYPIWEQINLPKAASRYKLDVLHCTCNTAPLMTGVPMVLTLHDIIYLESVSFKGTAYQNFGNLYRRYVVPRIVGKCEKVLTVSHFEKEKIIARLDLPEDKVEVVYNAINRKFRKIDDEEQLAGIRKTYDLPEDFILLFGNTAPKKNTIGALKAYVSYCNQVSDPLPMVITDIEPAFIEKLLQEMGARHLRDKLHLKDYIAFDQLPYVYSMATFFLYPSLRESFGMPILEAMACGTPVITSDTSSMPEVAGSAALLSDPFKPDSIASQMVKMHEDEALRTELITKGLNRASEFNWTSTAEQVLSVYKSMHQIPV
ncbi:glycosyltransferase family 4 protein [Roseivirga sp. BDSF3-8]|uniref:glycosyltransferase family 4 protein n=1 Tax=Roseivirga sp. BDSF3-8 TaxID=3241598 RepID=UPI0035320ADA